jgi:hypothetical protein
MYFLKTIYLNTKQNDSVKYIIFINLIQVYF